MPNQTNLDPFVPEVLEEPYAVYAELRRRGVYQLPDTPMFIATRFRDVEYVLMHPELFSVHGLTLRLAEGKNDFRYAINPVIRGLKELHIECDPQARTINNGTGGLTYDNT